jgi:hypothetical protein
LVASSTNEVIAWVLFGFALMPSALMMYPSIFPLLTPKIHFSGLSLRPACLRLAKVSFDMNPQGFVVDLSMRSVRNSIWGWR